MKLSIAILLTIAASINAASSGYKYPQPQQHHQSIPQLVRPAPPAINLPPPVQHFQPQQQYQAPQQHHQQQVLQQQSYSQQSVQQFAQQQSHNAFPQSHQQQLVQQPQQNFQSYNRPQTAIITKDIFIHSAPEDHDFELGSAPQYDSGPVRKNYRIVFIKAPSTNLRNAAAALQRAQSQNEEKTVIYVLSKKPDLSEVQQQLQLSQGEQKVNKPEVYFIKYKTQEEAQRAQQEIQAQYDALGGTSRVTDEGVAPIASVGALNLGGQIGGGNGGQTSYQQSSHQQQSFQSQSAPGREYLPSRAVKT